MGLYGKSDKQLASAYEASTPGTGIPESQKAERMERRLVKQKYGGVRRRRGATRVGGITIPKNSACWCECGYLKGHEQPCKES